MEFSSEQVANFCAVTGANDVAANHYLSAAGGNLEMAISLYLDNQNRDEGDMQEVRAPIKPKRSTLVESGPEQIYSRPVIEPFRNVQLESTERGKLLAKLFRPPMEIIFAGPLELARKVGKQEQKWILVTLHNPTEFACQQMIRDVWNEGAVQDFIREQIIFLFLTDGTVEGQRYVQFYGVDAYPHWALLDPRTGKRVKVGAGKSASDVLMQLVEYVTEHPIIRSSSLDKNVNAYEDKAAVAVFEDKIEGESIGSEKSSIVSEKLPVTAKMSPLVGEEPEEGSSTVTLQFRLSDGKRVKRRFHIDDKIQVIFDFILSTNDASFDIVQMPSTSLTPLKNEPISAHPSLKSTLLTVQIQ